MQGCTFVWRVTPDISFDLAKVTDVVSGLHLILPRSWLSQLFFPAVALQEWDDFHHICLTADQLVLTQALLARPGRFVASFLVYHLVVDRVESVRAQCSRDPQGVSHYQFCLE